MFAIFELLFVAGTIALYIKWITHWRRDLGGGVATAPLGPRGYRPNKHVRINMTTTTALPTVPGYINRLVKAVL